MRKGDIKIYFHDDEGDGNGRICLSDRGGYASMREKLLRGMGMRRWSEVEMNVLEYTLLQ